MGQMIPCPGRVAMKIQVLFSRSIRGMLAFGLCVFYLAGTAVPGVEAARQPSSGRSGTNPNCPPLAAPGGATVTVKTEQALRYHAAHAAPGTTILVSPGTYDLQDTVQVLKNNLTIRGLTGNREDVILDGGGMLSGQTHVIYIDADDAAIADLTIRNAGEHGISVQGRDRPVLYNLHILDTGYQLVKVNPLLDGSQDGLLACSRLEYTTTAPEDYTNGISAHNAHRWVVRDNEWYRIRTPNNVPAPTILFWSGSSGTIVERNLLVDCYQGIAFGNASHGSGDHSGGIVRNNFIYASLRHDSVIEMVHAAGWVVAHNTALLLDPEPGLSWGMEARFSDTSGTYAYNLLNMGILNRDGAGGTLTGNVTTAGADWFINPGLADLHLRASAAGALDQAVTLTQVSDDFDGEARPTGLLPDVGADEYSPANSPTIITAHFRSEGTYDGWVIESAENSGQGSTLNAAASTFNLGDNAQDRQYRTILSFNTASLPDDAVLTRASLRIRRQSLVGTNPFNTHGSLLVDIRKGRFGGNIGLQFEDFQAAASKNNIGSLPKTPVGGWYTRHWASGMFVYINKIGPTQFRLRFATDDNDDREADYLKFYSGDAAAASRPELILEYYVP